MKTVIVDTDILIDFLRGSERAKDFLLSVINDFDVCCSAITVAEIYAGMRDHEQVKTENLIDSLIILDVTREIAEKAGRYKRSLKGYNLELDDCFIAATAAIYKAYLATGNERHYPMKDIKKIKVY
ncbi:MAG: type II toxin-antitoxin system VapC family toxin [Thermodesulfovibrionales bacterium]